MTVATNILYNQFIKNEYVKPADLQKWLSISPGLIPEEEWPDILRRPYQCLRETKLQSLQSKIIHKIINCNKKLFDMKLKETPMCSYCDETDDISHFFVHCDNVTDNRIILNFCILHMQNYIYKQRLFVNNNLVLGEFKRILLIENEKKYWSNKIRFHSKLNIILWWKLKKSDIKHTKTLMWWLVREN